MNRRSDKSQSKNESYYALNMRIKGVLNEIIDLAYESEPDMIPKYKAFKFYVVKKELTSSGGMYHSDDRKIEVYNPSLGAKFLAKAALHELSHHIEYTKKGKTGHQITFYTEYRRLIYASLDLGILDRDDFKDEWASDRNKVKKMIEEYVPCPKERKKAEKSLIKVYNAYSVKDILKSQGYGWNGLEQVWEKQSEFEDLEEDLLILCQNGISNEKGSTGPYYVCGSSDIKVSAMLTIIASGKTYEKKEALKKHGFKFNSDSKQWYIKLSAEEWKKKERHLKGDAALSEITFSFKK